MAQSDSDSGKRGGAPLAVPAYWPEVMKLASLADARVPPGFRKQIIRSDDEDVDPVYRTGQMILDQAWAARDAVCAHRSGDPKAFAAALHALHVAENGGVYDPAELKARRWR